jgi:hypothetical protein
LTIRHWHVLALVLAVKALLFAWDSTIRLYLGDSAAYLYGAMDNGRLPDDRSFTYSFLIRGLVTPFEQLRVLGLWQSLAGALIAFLLYRVLERHFGVTRPRAAAIGLLVAVEPAQLYYERMALAETFGLLAFVCFFVATVAYTRSARLLWLPAIVLLALAAATLRLNYLPVVLVMSILPPALLWLQRGVRVSRPRMLAHLLVAAVLVGVTHGSYRHWVGQIFSAPPAYLGRAGFMELGLVLPLVKPQHFERVGLSRDIERTLRYPLDDPHARMRHLWSDGGLIRELRTRKLPVEPIARELSRLAIREDPLGLVRLGLHTVGDYFREPEIQHALDNDLGRRVIPPEMLWSLREEWGYDASDLHERVTPISRYFELGTWWLVGCLLVLAPLSVFAAWAHWHTHARVPALVTALFGLGLVASHVLFVPVALYRYLHPLPWFVMLLVVATYSARQPARVSRTGDLPAETS